MSYKDGDTSDIFYDPATFMILDVLALQHLYGANPSQNAGDDNYSFLNNAFYTTIYDAAGRDMVDQSSALEGWLIVLPDQKLSSLVDTRSGVVMPMADATRDVPNNLTWLAGDIEDAKGSNFTDLIYGTRVGNDLYGLAGNDVLSGEAFGGTYDKVSAQVVRLYQACLDRLPDPDGHSYWMSSLTNGMEYLTAVEGFVNSPEFQNVYGPLTNPQFVTLLYNNVLDRAPDPGGQAYWEGRLAGGMSREEVVAGFAESPEFIHKMLPTTIEFSHAVAMGQFTDEVVRLYQATLDRLPDPDGFSYWTGSLTNGMDYLTAVQGFVNSPEFQNVYGPLTNTQFVTLLYNNVLDRAPDPVGQAYWEGRLAGGVGREEVVAGFAESFEFIEKMAPVIEFWAEGLGPDDTLDGGVGDDVLVGGIFADEFHFSHTDGGNDRVSDFELWDTIVLDGFNFADAQDAASAFVQDGADAVLGHANGEIRLVDTDVAQLTADEFVIV